MKNGKDLRGLLIGVCLLAAWAGLVFTGSGSEKALTEPPRKETSLSGAVPPEKRSSGEETLPPEAGGGKKDKEPASADEEKTAGTEKTHRGPFIAIVIDDFGFSRAIADGYRELDLPLTWSIIPFQAHSLYAAHLAEASGIPYMIHMPMAAGGDRQWDEKAGVIDSGMSAETVTLLLRKAIVSLPGALGMNNHRGSRATRDEKLMETVMTELASTPLFFLDSRTSAASVAYNTARARGIPSAFCSVFIDHEPSEEFMEKQFGKGLALAVKRGWVVMIAHTRQGTLDFLKKKSESLPVGATFVTMPELMHLLWGRSGMQPGKDTSGAEVFNEGRGKEEAREEAIS